MNVTDAKNQVIRAGIELSESGLIARTWGNVSCRTAENRFAITASGRNYMTLTPEEIVEINIDDLSYEGSVLPSSELKVHREIYRIRQDAGFVIHTHQNNASAVAAMGLREISFDRDYPCIGNRVLCAEYGLPGTDKLCRNTAKAVAASEGRAVIMSNHGVVCWGKDYDEAFQAARSLEEACGRFLEDIGVDAGSFSGCAKGRESGNVQSIADHAKGSAAEAAGSDGTSGCVLWNESPIIIKYAGIRNELKPYLDDFAQIAGTGLKVIDDNEKKIGKALKKEKTVIVKGKGALCIADSRSDCEALSMVIEKNCMAALASIGVKPINYRESLKMRRFYLKKYSKRDKA